MRWSLAISSRLANTHQPLSLSHRTERTKRKLHSCSPVQETLPEPKSSPENCNRNGPQACHSTLMYCLAFELQFNCNAITLQRLWIFYNLQEPTSLRLRQAASMVPICAVKLTWHSTNRVRPQRNLKNSSNIKA